MEPEKITLPSADDVRAGLKRLLPVLKTITRLTPTPVDDAAVIFLESLLANSNAPLPATI